MTLDAKTDGAFWDYSWEEYGLYDDVANISHIKEISEVDKVFYIGFSLGTIQMFYGLAHKEDEFFADHVHKVIQLAPCYAGKPSICFDEECVTKTRDMAAELGIYSTFGPNWEENLEKIEKNFPEDVAAFYKSGNEWGLQPVSYKVQDHWNQQGVMNRFQEYADDWSQGVHETELVPIENIKQVPITQFVAENDQSCTIDTAMEYVKRIRSQTESIVVEGADHMYFSSVASDEWFMNHLLDQLQVEMTFDEKLDALTEAAEDVGDALQGLEKALNTLFMTDSAVYSFGVAAVVAAVASYTF